MSQQSSDRITFPILAVLSGVCLLGIVVVLVKSLVMHFM